MERFDELGDEARALEERLGVRLDRARERVRDANERLVAFIQERPGTAVLAALAIGFVVGRLASR